MQGAEAFFNKPSPFQKAAEKEREEAEAAAEGDARVANAVDNAVDSAETAVETTGEVVEVRFVYDRSPETVLNGMCRTALCDNARAL